MLDNAHELFTNAPGFASIESEDILVQISLKVFRFESTLIRSSDQTFDQGRHQVDTIELVTCFGWLRPYTEAFSVEKANRIIAEGIGAHFDPDVAEAFFSIQDEILQIKERFQEKDK